MKIKNLFLICLAVVGCFVFTKTFSTSDSPLKSIEKNDRQQLTILFEDFIYKNHFGLVLIGEKPIAIAGYFNSTPLWNMLYGRGGRRVNFTECWKGVEKYKSVFSSEDFLILRENESDNGDIQLVTLINKRLFLKTIHENIDLFQKTLGVSFDPLVFLESISQSKASLFEALRRDEGLYGILLGYGRENALAFKRKLLLAKLFDSYYKQKDGDFSLIYLTPSEKFSSLEEEYEWYEKNLVPLDFQSKLTPITPAVFMAFKNSEETKFLKEKYRKAQKKLVDVYANKDILEVVVKQLQMAADNEI